MAGTQQPPIENPPELERNLTAARADRPKPLALVYGLAPRLNEAGLGALAMPTGCPVSEIDCVQKGLRTVLARNRVQQAIFGKNNLAGRPLCCGGPKYGRDDKRNQIYENRELFGTSAVHPGFRTTSDIARGLNGTGSSDCLPGRRR
jgi:hypothetical protein